MTKEDFEDWVDSHLFDALVDIDGPDRSVQAWIKLLALQLKTIAAEQAQDASDDYPEKNDDDDDDLSDDLLGEDDEEVAV